MTEENKMSNEQPNDLSMAEVVITVKSAVAKDEIELLSIIKECLERDFVFRTRFANRRIRLDYENVNNASEDKKD